MIEATGPGMTLEEWIQSPEGQDRLGGENSRTRTLYDSKGNVLSKVSVVPILKTESGLFIASVLPKSL